MSNRKYMPPNGHVILLECIEEGVQEALCGCGLSPAAEAQIVDRASTEIMASLGAHFVMDPDERDWYSAVGPNVVNAMCEVIKLRREVEKLMRSK